MLLPLALMGLGAVLGALLIARGAVAVGVVIILMAVLRLTLFLRFWRRRAARRERGEAARAQARDRPT